MSTEQDITYLNKWTRVQSVIAKCDAVRARIQGMLAENLQRQHLDLSMAYRDEEFQEAEAELKKLASELMEI